MSYIADMINKYCTQKESERDKDLRRAEYNLERSNRNIELVTKAAKKICFESNEELQEVAELYATDYKTFASEWANALKIDTTVKKLNTEYRKLVFTEALNREILTLIEDGKMPDINQAYDAVEKELEKKINEGDK